MNRKTILTSTILAAIAAAALAGCSSQSSPAPGVTPATVAHDPVVAYKRYQMKSQLAEGLFLAGSAAMDIHHYYDAHGKLPANNAAAMAAGSRNDPAFSGPGKYVGSVTVGPTPGEITVAWARGALAGKSLVLTPVRADRLCFRVDASTTVPDAVLANANIVDECQPDE